MCWQTPEVYYPVTNDPLANYSRRRGITPRVRNCCLSGEGRLDDQMASLYLVDGIQRDGNLHNKIWKG